MFSDLPDDTVIVLTVHGEQELWRIVTGTVREGRLREFDLAHGIRGITGLGRELQVGETVRRCVMKGFNLEVRRTYVIKPGDVECHTYPNRLFAGQTVYDNRLTKRI